MLRYAMLCYAVQLLQWLARGRLRKPLILDCFPKESAATRVAGGCFTNPYAMLAMLCYAMLVQWAQWLPRGRPLARMSCQQVLLDGGVGAGRAP